jgi:glycosyltransferase involved in cell wall biosynthesis
MDYLHKRGYPVAYGINGDAEASGMIQDADLVVMHRLAWRPEDQWKALRWRDLLHSNNKALAYEIDDDIITEAILERIHLTNRGDYTDEQIEVERRQHLFAIQISDGVICSTEHLASIVRKITDRPVIVVPNALDVQRFQTTLGWEGTIEGRPPRVGWIGGNRPNRDAEALALAWNRIARQNREVRFLVGGYPLPVLMDAVPPHRLDHIPWRPVAAYPRTFAHLDIGCCPLNDEPFNRAKSWIKAMEYAAAGAAVVASPVSYDGLIVDNATGLIARTADDWTAHISHLLEYPDKRRYLAESLLKEVQEKHSLEANAWRWPEAWAAIVADFRVRLLNTRRGGGSTLPRRTEYDVATSPVLRV